MDLMNFPIKMSQSTLPENKTPKDDQQGQYHDITVSKVKPKQWTSWRETLVQKMPHPPEDMAFKQWRNPAKTIDSSQSSQESFKSPELKTQGENLENKPSTSRGVEIYEGRAGDTSKT